MNNGHKITVEDIETHVTIPSDYLRIIQHLAQEFSYDSMTSPVACQDLIKAALRAHAALNQRSEVCVDDLVVVVRIRPFLRNPFSPHEGQIVRLRAEGLSVDEICRALHKGNYRGYVQRTIDKAKLRGILDE
jgi:DNA-binding NarL/FixJ family response regulator